MSLLWKSGLSNEGGFKGWICLFYHVNHFDNGEPAGIFCRSGVVYHQKCMLVLGEMMADTMGYLRQIAHDSSLVF